MWIVGTFALVAQLTGASRQAQPSPSMVVPTVEAPPQGISVVWREFRPATEWTAGPAPTIRLCGAALQRGSRTSAVVFRLCSSVVRGGAPRRFALGYDSFDLAADLPGGHRLDYALLRFQPTGPWTATALDEGPNEGNDVPVHSIGVRNVTDIVIALDRELPFGLPTVSIKGVFDGQPFDDTAVFMPLGTDEQNAERLHLVQAPGWATQPP